MTHRRGKLHPEQHPSFLQEVRQAAEFIPQTFYFVSLSKKPVEAEDVTFMTTDKDYLYEHFFADFGPLNLAKVYRYCYAIRMKLEQCAKEKKVLYHYTALDPHKRSNGAFLVCCYSLLVLKRSVQQSFLPLLGCFPPLSAFRDASYGLCTYTISVLDCLKGLHKAQRCNFLNLQNFDCESYEHYEKIENGDLNWIIPNKFVAFSGPHDKARAMQGGLYTLSADDYSKLFKRLGISAVIRLNTPNYDKNVFLNTGIEHYDMFFKDGTTPSGNLLGRFFNVVEGSQTFAIHCKAGLGRTGSLIGAYMMKYHGFTPKEAIAWMRIVRPGSVIGPQQHWLEQIYPRMKRLGDRYRNGFNVPEDSRKERHDQTGFPRVYMGESHSKAKPHTSSSSRGRNFVNILARPSTEESSSGGNNYLSKYGKANKEIAIAQNTFNTHLHARFGQNSLARRRTPKYETNTYATTTTNKHYDSTSSQNLSSTRVTSGVGSRCSRQNQYSPQRNKKSDMDNLIPGNPRIKYNTGVYEVKHNKDVEQHNLVLRSNSMPDIIAPPQTR